MTDTSLFLVSEAFIIEKIFSSSYSASGNNYEVTTTYPGLAGEQTPLTSYSYNDEPELIAKVQIGWNVFRTVSDSFCVFIDSSFKVAKKPMRSLTNHTSMSIDNATFSKHKLLSVQKLSSSKYKKIYVIMQDNGEINDSTILSFDSKMNNRIVNARGYPNGNHFVSMQSFSNTNQNAASILSKQIEVSFIENNISSSDKKLAKKLIKLYQKNY